MQLQPSVSTCMRCSCLCSDQPRMLFFLLINVTMLSSTMLSSHIFFSLLSFEVTDNFPLSMVSLEGGSGQRYT